MTWIDERIAERDNENRRQQLITTNAERIFGTLWQEIEPLLTEANDKGGFGLRINGIPYSKGNN
jgi:hypothetical protein